MDSNQMLINALGEKQPNSKARYELLLLLDLLFHFTLARRQFRFQHLESIHLPIALERQNLDQCLSATALHE